MGWCWLCCGTAVPTIHCRILSIQQQACFSKIIATGGKLGLMTAYAPHNLRPVEEKLDQKAFWIKKVTEWRDSHWNSVVYVLGVNRPLRPSTRRFMKWEDSLRRFTGNLDGRTWKEHAQDNNHWNEICKDYIHWSLHGDSEPVS